jgi:hypothetical protein
MAVGDSGQQNARHIWREGFQLGDDGRPLLLRHPAVEHTGLSNSAGSCPFNAQIVHCANYLPELVIDFHAKNSERLSR